MEIERKWLVSGLPGVFLPVVMEQEMEQGYLTVRPTVRIRKEAEKGGKTEYVLCLKSGAGIARQEIEIRIEEAPFRELEKLIGIPLIEKERRVYSLRDGLLLEVNDVDREMPTHYMYAEIEYPSLDAAKEWKPDPDGLTDYLADDVTDQPGQTMAAYWDLTRRGIRRL